MGQFLQKSKQISLLSAFIQQASKSTSSRLAQPSRQAIQRALAAAARAIINAVAWIGLLRPSSLAWLSPRADFDLNILLLIYQALSDPYLSLRQFQISVLTWKCL